jgi:hypothetical protein
MAEQLMKYLSHPLAAVVFGFILILAVAGLLFRLFQGRKRNQYIKLRKDILRIIEDEMVGIKSDISVVIENELSKMKKNISTSVRNELFKLKGNIPGLIKEEVEKLNKTESRDVSGKIIELNKNKSFRQVTGNSELEVNKGETLDVEKEIAKLNRNMSVVTALLVDINHRTAKTNSKSPQKKAEESSNLGR